PNVLECAAQDGYPLEMDDKLSNSEKGRQTALANRIRKSQRDDSRLDVAIIEAALAGAKTLKSLAAALNSAKVVTRSGRGEWSISLVSTELERMGYSIKALNAHLAPPKGGDLTKGSELALRAVVNTSGFIEFSNTSRKHLAELLFCKKAIKASKYSVVKISIPQGTPYDTLFTRETTLLIDQFVVALGSARPNVVSPSLSICMEEEKPMTWSEESFWKAKDEELRLAERKGEWLLANKLELKRGDIVHHNVDGYGTYFDGEDVLRCRYRMPDGQFHEKYLQADETKVFRWKSEFTADMRRDAIAHIRATYLTDAELVESTSITLAQKLARSRAIRWL
ncbi:MULTISPECIES: hypothetical protein, partial [unclassified Novosphingobium]|uniref:hypothetical protein n=1 Tax=unclassified Novosphingobium TaxID=2644732 RepID=UPI001F428739